MKYTEIKSLLLDIDMSIELTSYIMSVLMIPSMYTDKLEPSDEIGLNRFYPDKHYNIDSIDIGEVVLVDEKCNKIEGLELKNEEVQLVIYTGLAPILYCDKMRLDEQLLSNYLIYLVDNVRSILSIAFNPSIKDDNRDKYFITDNTNITYRFLINIGTVDKMDGRNNRYINIEFSDILESLSDNREDETMIDRILDGTNIEFKLSDDYNRIIKANFGIDL